MSQAEPSAPTPTETRLRASTVALDGRALLILGPSGSGKSTLALDLITLGATLVADDQTVLQLRDGAVWAQPHPNIRGRIEARFVGLLKLPFCEEAEVGLAIDLGQTELHRLPPHRTFSVLGKQIDLLHRPPGGHAASALLQCLLQRRDTP